MRLRSGYIPILRLQALCWLIVFGLDFISNLQFDPPIEAGAYAILAMFFYAAVVYGNGSWLIPRFYQRRRYVIYTTLAILLVASSIFIRSLGAVWIQYIFKDHLPARLSIGLLTYGLYSGIWIFIFSILYRLAMDYFSLSRRQNVIAAEKARTELHLLKQQVHPHFLFNTLNNIYYVARKGSPEAADLIERLSAIMRYFTEESKKDEVPLHEEIELLRNYIRLECIRMRFEMPVDFDTDPGLDDIMVPPLLFLPLVENIFKHGVDKRSRENFAGISLRLDRGKLLFTTRNRCVTQDDHPGRGGTGLSNLRQRLSLYFDDRYELTASASDCFFITSLHIPVYAN
jgi:sensor histidine kinase YesM